MQVISVMAMAMEIIVMGRRIGMETLMDEMTLAYCSPAGIVIEAQGCRHSRVSCILTSARQQGHRKQREALPPPPPPPHPHTHTCGQTHTQAVIRNYTYTHLDNTR